MNFYSAKIVFLQASIPNEVSVRASVAAADAFPGGALDHPDDARGVHPARVPGRCLIL